MVAHRDVGLSEVLQVIGLEVVMVFSFPHMSSLETLRKPLEQIVCVCVCMHVNTYVCACLLEIT